MNILAGNSLTDFLKSYFTDQMDYIFNLKQISSSTLLPRPNSLFSTRKSAVKLKLIPLPFRISNNKWFVMLLFIRIHRAKAHTAVHGKSALFIDGNKSNHAGSAGGRRFYEADKFTLQLHPYVITVERKLPISIALRVSTFNPLRFECGATSPAASYSIATL